MQLSLFKKCSQCGQVKFITEFCKDNRAKDGYNAACKECRSYQNKHWRETHKSYDQEKHREWRDANKEYRQNYNRAWRAAHAESHKEYCKEWYQSNVEHVRAYRAQHLEHRRRYKHDTYHNNPETRRKVKGCARAQHHKRREKLSQSSENFTREEWFALCAKYDHRCLACGEKKPLTVDHIIPVCKGGNNSIQNIQCLCKPCNSKKGIQIIDYRK